VLNASTSELPSSQRVRQDVQAGEAVENGQCETFFFGTARKMISGNQDSHGSHLKAGDSTSDDI
jgi:hypothetical protein